MSIKKYIQIKQNIVRFVFCFITTFPYFSFSQNNYRLPVDFPIGLSATFGEPRTNHYHSGLDIRTQQVTGKKVYAIADGYVSRISISPSGYGKALYITHPDGNTSVYGHLFKFNEKIRNYVTVVQYQQESFAINLILDPLQLPVKKGEVIALTGNSGSSGGPHLHFEIRDTETENPLNPQAFGITVADNISPEIQSIRLIPKALETTINGKQEALNLLLIGNNGQYKLAVKDTIQVAGIISLGIDTKDRSTGSTAGTGVYSIELQIDKKTVFLQKMDRLNFNDSRCVNSTIDYVEYCKTKTKYQTTEIQPGNTAKIYEICESSGKFSFYGNKIYEIKYIIRDFAKNTAIATFHIKGVSVPKTATKSVNNDNELSIIWNHPFEYATEEMRFICASETFFDDILLNINIDKSSAVNFVSPIYTVGNRTIPMKHPAQLYLKPIQQAVKQYDSCKLLIVLIDEKGKYKAQESVFKDGYISAKIHELGRFAIMVDDKPPVITPINIVDNKNIANQTSIKIKITDNLSGIKSYTGRLNGKWILMDYDPKNNLLEYVFDDRLIKGSNIFTIEVSDYSENTNTLKMNLIY